LSIIFGSATAYNLVDSLITKVFNVVYSKINKSSIWYKDYNFSILTRA